MASDVLLMDFAGLSQSLGARHFSFSNSKGFTSVSIDSRNVEQGSLFIALPGAATDGHCHITEAFNAGASCAMVESAKLESFNLIDIAKKMGKDLLAVENTLRAFQNAARVYLEKFPKLLKIGMTGSTGKTTTKEIASAIISSEKNTVMNMGNLNSETGLPLSAFTVRSEHEAGIFEMGMNRKGEISELAGILKPNIALITNIGHAHIGILGTKQEIAKEKKNIFSCFTDNDIALIPQHDEYRDFLAEDLRGKIRFYGEDSITGLEGVSSLGLDGSEIRWAGERIHFALPGKHFLADALAAIAIAREVPVRAGAIKKGLESVRPMFGRNEILRGRCTVIRDCYNSSPESAEKTLEFCNSLDWNGRRIYVMADMLELGNNSRLAHEQLGRLLAESKADDIFLFGKETAATAAILTECSRNFFRTEEIKELSSALDRVIQSSDLVLLKGSRGCALERLSGILTGVNNVS